MNAQERTELMHAVLDGEATAEQARALAVILAVNARARAEFEELKALFDGLKAVPRPYAPEGLAASVMARIPESTDRSKPRFTSDSLNQVKPARSRIRKIWVGAGVAAAATAIVLTSGIVEFPSSGKETAGAIVPAQRLRAEQPNANDLKVDAPTASSTAVPAAGDVSDAARGDAARDDATRGSSQ